MSDHIFAPLCHQIKTTDVTDCWNNYLGSNQTNIKSRNGRVDADRIFSADGTRSIRFGSHEMNSKPSKFIYT